MTVAIELHWKVRAPAPRIFDLARSVDAHVASTEGTREKAVGGKTSGLLDLGDGSPGERVTSVSSRSSPPA